MLDVTAIGEVLVDFATRSVRADGYPLMEANPGGAPCNFLAALSKYGMHTAFLGKVGDDVFGHLLRDTLRGAGIETGGLVMDSQVFTTLAFVTFDEQGDRAFSFARKPGADACLRLEELDLSLVERAKVLHFGTLSLTCEPARAATRQAVACAKEGGKLLSFDPNLRESLWRDAQEARSHILWGLEQADIVKISDSEAAFLWQCSQKEAAQRLLDEFDVSLAMVTLGAEGCYLRNRQGGAAVPAFELPVADTTGAGDIFAGSALSRIIKLGKHPAQLSEAELAGIATFASAAAGLSTTKSGGIPSIPAETEVEALCQRKKPEIRTD